jgi:hypothetical protein
MSDAMNQPSPKEVCGAPGRRRAVTKHTRAARQSRPRNTCPKRQRLLDPDHEAFVDWFVSYWHHSGAQLFASETTGTEA